MARRPRLFAADLLYHVIVRGNQRQKTFLTEADYQAYLERLARYRKKYDYCLYAYCLMPNHVHLLLQSSHHPLGKFMQGLQQSYSQYFNLRHRKVGHVFQGRYKAIICDKDEYLLELIRYIHFNPVRAGMVKTPELYRYSGHQDYLEAKPSAVLDPRRALALKQLSSPPPSSPNCAGCPSPNTSPQSQPPLARRGMVRGACRPSWGARGGDTVGGKGRLNFLYSSVPQSAAWPP